jgi:hypothetical protein
VTGPDDAAEAFDGGELEDDGVLEPSDSLDSDRLDADVLDTGIDAATRWAGSTRYGTTLAEERQGEGLDRLLAQEQPDPLPDDAWTDEDEPTDDGRVPLPRAGRLVAEDEGAHGDDDADLFAADAGIDGGGASAEEAAVHLTDEPDFRR